MILDAIHRGDAYVALHPRFAKAFAFLQEKDLAALPDGRYEVDGDAIYVLVMTVDGRGQSGAKFEAHQRYIDIQAVISGEEVMGWSPIDTCSQPTPFDTAKDVGFYSDKPAAWMRVPPGSFALFFPEDVHAPLAGTGKIKKAVVKVAV